MPDQQAQAYDLLASAASTGALGPDTVEALVALGDDALPAIEHTLTLPDRAPRRAAVLALARLSGPAVPAALRLFVDGAFPDESDLLPDSIAALAERAGEAPDPGDADRFARLSVAPWAPIRLASLALAPALEADVAGPTLLRLSRDPHPSVAALALQRLVQAADAPSEFVWRARLGSPIPEARNEAIDEIAATEGAADLLRHILGTGDAYALPASLAAAARLEGAGLDDLLLPLAEDPALPAALRALAIGGLEPAHGASAEFLVRTLKATDPVLRVAAGERLTRSEARAALRQLGSALAEADPLLLERVADVWARQGNRAHGILVPGATAALERLAHVCFASAACTPAAMGLLRALLAAHLCGVVLEDATVAAVARWTWSQDSRVAALARRVHQALSQAPVSAELDPQEETIRRLLASGEDADLLAAIDLLSTPARVAAWLEPLIEHLPSASDEVLTRACALLAAPPSSDRARAVLQRLVLHPSATVRATAMAATASVGGP